MKYIFIIFFSFCGLFFNNGLKAAEKINIKFEEMEIPLTIEQLSKLEKYKDDSTELLDWLKNNGLIMWCGNGGSASDSMHFAAELIGRFNKNRKSLRFTSICKKS